MQEKTLSSSQVNKYGFYLLTSSLAAMVQMTYLTIFMTDMIGIPAAIVATTLLIARFIDLIIGILCGGIIEKVHLPWGKYRSWLLLLRWVIVFSLVCSFFDTSAWPLAFRVGVSFIGYILLNACMSFTTNAYYALGPALAGANLNDRNRLSARGAQFMCVAMLITSAATIPLVTFLTPYTGPANAYLAVAVVFALPYILGCQMVSDLCRECDPSGKRGEQGAGVSTVTLKDMIQSVVQNKQLLILFLSYTIYYIGLYTISGLGTYYFTYIVGNYMNMSYSMTVTMITGFLSSLIMPKLGGKLGKKRSFVLALIIYAAAYACVYFIGGNWILFTLMGAIGGGAVYMFTGFGVNYFVDCGEYHLYKTGKDTRMIAIAMYSVPMKIGMMLGGAVATYGLAMIGYHAGITVTPEFQTDFMILLAVIPAVLVLIGALIMQFGYKITDEDAAMYAAENAKRAKGE
ncbi:MAG TPA: MFS transporter [Candidatus Blautia pullistercoris]|uniref:MFS transporter n=1 Tax=Candidatus Blautia pullistercoris TaxID=2838499 RepID=A0A9D1VPM9_9FIRM|nr:MFS transporter [Clostridiales bacterium]HIX38919.1 MFS transporter [Candidatus Blautia pullistercoris]